MNQSGLIIFFLCLAGSLQAQWREDFSAFPFYQHAPWTGDTGYWSQEQGWLKSKGPAVSGTKIQLQRAVTSSGDFELRFDCKLQFATSSNNYLELELNDSPGGTSLIVMLGNTADEVSVYLRDSNGDTMLIDGLDKRLSSSSSNRMAVRLRMLQDQVSLELGPEGDTTLWIPEGMALVPSFQPRFLRIRATYTASNADRFWIDAVYFGIPEMDHSAPYLLSFYDADSLNWLLQWSEALDTLSGSVHDATGDILPFIWTSASSMRCAVDKSRKGPFTFRAFRDQSGNVTSDTILTLHFHPYFFREIQISELLPDPSPPQGLPEVEWIELHHTGNNARQLKDFLLADQNTTHLFPEYFMEANSRLILTSKGNCSLLASYGNCLELGFSTSFLNNSGDRITLLNRQGDTLERLEYSDSWHSDVLKRDGGYSLEKRDPLNHCLPDAANFITSPATHGGSPGRLNACDERVTDTLAPFIEDFILKGPTRMELVFNEEIDVNKVRFIHQNDSLPLTQLAGRFYQVEWPDPLPDDARKIYHANLIGMEDCSGNQASDSLEFRYALPVIPEPYMLIFTEILFKPNNTQAQFVEIFNRGENAHSLAGTSLIIDEKRYFLQNRLLYPGEVLILCRLADTSQFSGLPFMALNGMPVLSDKNAHLALRNVQDELLDAIHYADTQFRSWPQKAMGYSLQRLDSTRLCSYTLDWQPAQYYGGNPGKHSFIGHHPEPIIPKLQEIYPETNRLLRLKFSAPVNPEFPGFLIRDAWGTPLSWDLEGNDFRSWLLEWSDSLMPAQSYLLEISGLSGCNGENMPVQEMEFRLAALPELLRINEIMTDPIGDDPDFIELFNAGSEAMDLKGMKLCKPHADGTISEQSIISEQGYLLMPGSFVVLTESGHRLPVLYDDYDENRVLILKNFPSFPNASGMVMVLDSLGNVLDSVRYSDSYHSPVLTKTEGVSLERIDAGIRSGGGNNWTSAAASARFGTPGRKNSQSRESSGEDKKHWNLYSSSFSPDGDGFEDMALLHYSGLEPGSLVTAEVYGLNGILIYEWANNLPCGSSGVLKWEGFDEQGQSIPDGPYILRIRWINQQGISKMESLVLVKASLLSD